MKKNEKKTVAKGPTANARHGNYSGNKIIPNKAGKQPNPAESPFTFRVYSIPMTVKQEAAVVAEINL